MYNAILGIYLSLRRQIVNLGDSGRRVAIQVGFQSPGVKYYSRQTWGVEVGPLVSIEGVVPSSLMTG